MLDAIVSVINSVWLVFIILELVETTHGWVRTAASPTR